MNNHLERLINRIKEKATTHGKCAREWQALADKCEAETDKLKLLAKVQAHTLVCDECLDLLSFCNQSMGVSTG
jgi:hypothetical protein